MIFSYHPGEIDQPKDRFGDGWICWRGIVGDAEFNHRIRHRYTSPIVWLHGRRLTSNFVRASGICLDFDQGVALNDIVEHFRAYNVAIGTTKSHQLPKGEYPAEDRFRVYIGARGDKMEYMNLRLYRYICIRFAKQLGADFQCCDGARMFAPVKEVVYSNTLGKRLDIDHYNDEWEEYEVEQLEQRIHQARQLAKYANSRKLPTWIYQLLKDGTGGGSRNTACFKIAANMANAGFSCDEIVDMIMASAIPIGPQVRNEVELAVRSGIKNSSKSRS